MKKFVLTLISLITLGSVTEVAAQTFTVSKDTSKAVMPDLNGKATVTVTNTSGAKIDSINWRVLSHNLPSAPSKWFTNFGICDNNLCYSSTELLTLVGGNYPTKASLEVASGGSFTFYTSYSDLAGVTQYGPFSVSVELKTVNAPITTDTVTFVVNKWPTAINTVKTSDNVVLYPNPARDEVNVVFNNIPDVKTLTIVNMIGKVVDVYKVNTNSAKINIENLPSGVYILRLTDSQGHVMVNRKFTHQ